MSTSEQDEKEADDFIKANFDEILASLPVYGIAQKLFLAGISAERGRSTTELAALRAEVKRVTQERDHALMEGNFRKLLCWLGWHEWVVRHWQLFKPTNAFLIAQELGAPWAGEKHIATHGAISQCKHCGAIKL